MNLPEILRAMAPLTAERLLFSLGIGSLLAVLVWLLLYLLPKRDSRTSFVVWFSTLLITALLPLVGLHSIHGAGSAGGSRAVITVSSSWATMIFFVWASTAIVGLVRVVLALLQVQKLRSKSFALDERVLPPELGALVDEFRRSRPVELLVSKQLEVPTAVGFFKPAIVLPEWLLEGSPAEELKFILLHEMEHLRRRDDWTNLAQQVVKAFLFFLPSIWWIERRLSLDREMACDDAVLAHSGTPHAYAECLAHVAERSFLRRQLALAQAAVARLRQLTLRVAKIMDPSRPQPGRLWKPAVPAVVVVAGLCVFSGSQGPRLIGFSDGTPVSRVAAAQPAGSNEKHATQMPAVQVAAAAKSTPTSAALKPKVVAAKLSDLAAASEPNVRAWDAALRSSETQRIALKKRVPPSRQSADRNPKLDEDRSLRATLLSETMLPATSPAAQRAPQYVTVREEFYMVVNRQTPSSRPTTLQVHIVQISIVQAQPPQKQVPKKI
ncbi:MAG TPA: M56 family metallopeptidase [Candidatus Angelobacter sp.]|nr:M56 family metallopeptidase [Candidatus Angelobacter sp.]